MSKDDHRPQAPAFIIRHILLDPLEIVRHPFGLVSQIPAPHLIDPHEQDPIVKKGEIGGRRRIDPRSRVIPPIIVLDVDVRIAQGAKSMGIPSRIDPIRLAPVPKVIHPMTQRLVGIVAVAPIVVPDQEKEVSRIVTEGVAGMGDYLGHVGVYFLFAVFGLSGFDVADVDEEEKVLGLGVELPELFVEAVSMVGVVGDWKEETVVFLGRMINEARRKKQQARSWMRSHRLP